jgi:arylsulfatase A-like enzyme
MRYDEMDRVADLKPGGGFDWMRQHSTTFSKMWMADNLCCPARATALTGQTPYNNKVFDNSRFHNLTNTLPVWLQAAGYCTGFTGKYLNRYGTGSPRPPGWTYWQPVTSHLELEHGYSILNRAGKKVQPPGFITNELAAVSRSEVNDCLDFGKPTFTTYWSFAPRYDSDPEPKYSHVRVPWTPTDPSFYEADITDKPAWLQRLKAPSNNAIAEALRRKGLEVGLQQQETTRIRTLFSADDGVKSLIDLMRSRGELENTIFVLTSDNGWFLGEHRIDTRKDLAYEAGQVALWIAGPGFPARPARDAFVTNLDLVPTFVRAAGVKAGLPLDGRPIQDLLAERDLGRDRFLPLFVPDNSDEKAYLHPSATGVKTWRYKYLRYADGSEELYDLAKDPNELNSLASDPNAATLKRQMIALMEQGERCRGATCRESAPAGAALRDRLRQAPAAGVSTRTVSMRPEPAARAASGSCDDAVHTNNV